MKTQLLEDIGQSAALTLVPSGDASNSRADNAVPGDLRQAPAAIPVVARSATGVWRQKPAAEPAVLATPKAEQWLSAPEAPTVVDSAAAAEAQHVPAPPLSEADKAPAEPALAMHSNYNTPSPQSAVFDFTTPSPAMPTPDLSSSEPGWFERTGQRYLLWGLYAVAGGLFIQAGVWFYEERKEGAALAPVADESTVTPQAGNAATRRAIPAKQFTLSPGGEVQMGPAAPAPPPGMVPPLVMLEPDPTPATKVKAPPVQQAEHNSLRGAPKPERARLKRAPEHRLARAPVIQAVRKPEQDFSAAASLKACSAYGYSAAQCVKRACSVTKYGFVCRGK